MKEQICTPDMVRLKSNFLGPKAENGDWLEDEINRIFSHWCEWRRTRFSEDEGTISTADQNLSEFKELQTKISDLLSELNKRFESETPTYSPRYMGHMVSEQSLPAMLGHITGVLFNCNNSSLSVAKVGLQVEKEAIEALAEMIGFGPESAGHFTSGGTVANIEGLWRARYRLDNFLSLGAYLKANGDENWSIASSSQMGTESFKKHSSGLSVDELKKYSFVLQGAFKASQLYQKIFQKEFLAPILLAPAHVHYSWIKALTLLGFGEESLWKVDLDDRGHICLIDLKKKIDKAMAEDRPILSVVSVSGTTELGMIDPVNKVQDLLDEYKQNGVHIWHHIDGAYGGTYCSMLRGKGNPVQSLSEESEASLEGIQRAESVTLDPHKLALVPYSCGAILVRDEELYPITNFKAPYLLENPKYSGKWNSTLEGSRSATGACATWMVAKSLGLNKEGLGQILSLGLTAKNELERIIIEEKGLKLFPTSDTNIVCFSVLDESKDLRLSNQKTRKVYERIIDGRDFSVSQTFLLMDSYEKFIHKALDGSIQSFNDHGVYLIRMVLMNPFTISHVGENQYLDKFMKYLKTILHKI